MKKENTKRDFISFSDFEKSEIWDLLLMAQRLKRQPFVRTLQGRSVGLIFQKPSTRTSVSFAVGLHQMGALPLILSADLLQMKRGEVPKDTGRVLSRYLDAIVIRANRHEDIREMAKFASIPVINGLTDREHPCQVLADLLTIMEQARLRHPKELKGFRVSYLGDGNNVAQSWMLAAALLDMKLNLACPPGYEPKKELIQEARGLEGKAGGNIQVLPDPRQAVQGAQALYTDVWASMGQEAESGKRRQIFMPFQLNGELLSLAHPKALVMHCLPAHRGEEITNDILEGSHSVVFDQAENRLHAQKAVLARLIVGRKKK